MIAQAEPRWVPITRCFQDIQRKIEDAKVVITEITAPNQIVYYKVGYSCAQQADDSPRPARQGFAIRYSELSCDLLR
jgi:hypothetical protein